MKLFHWLIAISLLLTSPIVSGQTTSAEMVAAKRIQANVLGVDAHNETVQRILIENVDIGQRLADGTIDLPRLREGGMHVPFFALWVPSYYHGAEAVRRARRMGILSMTLTHLRNNNWADSSTTPPVHNGLTEFGRQVVREMNALGMMVDISHVSDKTFYDVLEVTTKPAIASHSSCFVNSDVPRNMKDDMFRALARNGGVVGVNFGSSFLRQEDAEAARQRFRGAFRK